jgi:gamma-glutamylcyclotransferase (GGCT)/AIG2-like uncharacterized protein YtfP
MIKVFVYGTLKSSYHNNYLLEGSQFISEAISVGKYWLIDGGIPYAMPPSNDDWQGLEYPIKGELWEVEDHVLHRLDQLEGHPDWYKRAFRKFRIDEYVEEDAWIYEYEHDDVNQTRLAQVTEYMGKTCYEWNR